MNCPPTVNIKITRDANDDITSVAQKRKELGLSQEGLGERLGVSRQAIYKWESDASLPEIDKLITLSKIFSLPVGWLLGVEQAGR